MKWAEVVEDASWLQWRKVAWEKRRGKRQEKRRRKRRKNRSDV